MNLVIFQSGQYTILLKDVESFNFYVSDEILFYKIKGSNITRKKENITLVRTADDKEILTDWQNTGASYDKQN